jgi:hypothetical protein
MKKILAAIVAAFLLLTAACEVPEDGKTAADRAEVNQKKKDKGGEASEDKGPQETAGQENARRSAEMYLDTQAFSRSGLIEQLEFEGFSTKDATYGVDAQKVDWNKQAAASAEAYLDMMGYSRDGLIEQLMFEGFTREQATYGVNQNGL